MSSLQQKVAIVTGGGSGIGKAISETLAARGAAVYILDLHPGSDNRTLACDVSKWAEVASAIETIAGRTGGIDILVNNAGIGFVGNLESTPEADLDRLYAINVKGIYNCALACVPHLRKRGGGTIVNMASVAATVGIAERFAYSMTKGAVLAMTYSIAKDYLADNIRCNSVSPARVHTPFVDDYLAKNYPGEEAEMMNTLSKTQPIGRMGQPREIAALVAYLCSDEATFSTGTDYPIDGGFIRLNT